MDVRQPRQRRGNEIGLAALLLVAGALVATGFWLASATAGLVSAGVCLALWSFLVFVDVR